MYAVATLVMRTAIVTSFSIMVPARLLKIRRQLSGTSGRENPCKKNLFQLFEVID